MDESRKNLVLENTGCRTKPYLLIITTENIGAFNTAPIVQDLDV